MQDMYHNIIKEICLENNIQCDFLSKGWIVSLEKDGVRRFISGYKMDITGHGFGTLMDDKYAMYDVLSFCDVPIIKHHILYYESNQNDYAIGYNDFEYLKELFHQYHCDIVMKTNSGSCGVGVYHVQDEESLYELYQKLGKKHRSLSVCPFYHIRHEFRCIVVDGQVELLYKKVRPVVVGDGHSTISQLLQEFNLRYFKDYQNDTILENGKIFEYDWRFNLSRGSVSSMDILEEDRKSILAIVLNITKKFQLPFGSIDIVKTEDNEFYVMEINSGVMMDNFIEQQENGYQIAKKVYQKAILSMFSK